MSKRTGPKPNANPAQLRAATRNGMDKAMVFCLTALADKFGFGQERLVEFVYAAAFAEGLTDLEKPMYDLMLRATAAMRYPGEGGQNR